MMSPIRLMLLAGVACVLAAPMAVAAPAGAPDYADPANWLCRPGRADVCSEPLTSTVVMPADGARTQRTYAPGPAAPIDCFYVYPTVSQETQGNADLTAGPEEKRVATQQLAHFAAVCRPYAPLYRQTTVPAMRGEVQGSDSELAYADVLAAWRHYLEHDNHGRGVVLIGHSQGSYHLERLISEQIEGKPAQALLVSAILGGGRLQVAKGSDTGGTFKHLPLCHGADQTGCVITYSSYLASAPPGPDARFGRAEGPGLQAACVDPAALLGHATLHTELVTRGEVAKVLGTTLVENPGLVSGACTLAGDANFLAISVKPEGVGAVTLGRALADVSDRSAGWGLHALDVSLTLGDLVEIVGRQSRAWLAAHR